MKNYKYVALIGAAGALAAFPSAAMAQDVEPFIGASAGYHDLGLGVDEVEGFEVDDSSPIFGVVAGVDIPISNNVFVGAEGNFHFGTNAIDTEYGVAARLGVNVGRASKFYVRGGYQEVDIDATEILDVDIDDDAFDGIDTSEGDYIVGLGAEFGIGDSPIKVRANIDTIAFDTTRLTAGVLYTF